MREREREETVCTKNANGTGHVRSGWDCHSWCEALWALEKMVLLRENLRACVNSLQFPHLYKHSKVRDT